MFVGHLAVGFIGKRLEPSVSLGTWMLAVMLADLVCYPLLIVGVEHFHTVPGVASNRMIGEIPYSHSLLLDIVWGGIFAAAYFFWRRNRGGAWLLFGAVLSHWVLDTLSHRPDIQIAPGIAAVLGFGLWNSVPATLLVEGGLWAVGIALYLRTTRAKGWLSLFVFWAVTTFLTLAWWGNIHRGMEADAVRAGAGGLIFFSLVVAWAYWMNVSRALCPKQAG